MKNKAQAGFSLIELLIVVVIIGVVAAMAVPNLQKGLRAAENGTTFATMRTIASSQAGFFSQKNRFARITELNTVLHEIIGTNAGDKVIRGEYVFEMNPATPTDAELRNEYSITATRTADSIVYKYELTQTGEITQILP
ncbi:MAG TPA: prepilin-type N-terminal cleavage/methylation domain-containing protein [Pyrinomonadaceae bacterium]|nr:prepilin-type N-terminal cleavage/methylation domain-containing protein [Pyrinomonadaceae bacterium]